MIFRCRRLWTTDSWRSSRRQRKLGSRGCSCSANISVYWQSFTTHVVIDECAGAWVKRCPWSQSWKKVARKNTESRTWRRSAFVRNHRKSRCRPELRSKLDNFAVKMRNTAHFDRLLGASAVAPNKNNGGAMGAEGGRKVGFNAWMMSTVFKVECCDDLWSLTEWIYGVLWVDSRKKHRQIIWKNAHLHIVTNNIKKQHSNTTWWARTAFTDRIRSTDARSTAKMWHPIWGFVTMGRLHLSMQKISAGGWWQLDVT